MERINGVWVNDFHCDENFMHYWFSRVRDLDIPIPETKLFSLEDGEPNYEEILGYMKKNEWERAFIRSDSFSDKINPKNGSRIGWPDLSEIKRTFETLKNHHLNHMESPLGEFVAVREWLDVNYYCELAWDCREWHPSEIRLIIDEGEIDYRFPSLDELVRENLDHDCTYDYVQERLEGLNTTPRSYAEEVAEEFDEYSWHVDFCLDTDMNWYCIDMGLNGVYWSENYEEWMAMTGQPDEREEELVEKVREIYPDGSEWYNE